MTSTGDEPRTTTAGGDAGSGDAGRDGTSPATSRRRFLAGAGAAAAACAVGPG
ncbi:MAG: twin-arginine translocation signal domain-containing protein, partial [Acidimicrobiales bacterium]